MNEMIEVWDALGDVYVYAAGNNFAYLLRRFHFVDEAIECVEDFLETNENHYIIVDEGSGD